MASHLHLDNVLTMIDGNESDLEGLESENSSGDEFGFEESFESEEGDASDYDHDIQGDEGMHSDDDIPLANLITAQTLPRTARKLTPSTSYKWSKRKFVPPENTEFLGDTSLPDNLPVDENGDLSPYALLKMFITNEMLEFVVEQTNIYSVEKTGNSINTSIQEIEQLIGMIYFMGLVQMPNLRSYWENELSFQSVAGVMSRNHFLKLLTLLHFVNNNNVTDEDKLDKLWKLRPWFEALKFNFLKIPPKECQSIDEIMVPFKGRSSLKVYMPKKPHKWGFKLWGRSDADGFLYDFDLCQPIPDNMVSELGRSAGVVEKLTQSLPAGKNFKAFADNYFSSIALAEKLKQRQIWYIGTINMNRIPSNPLPNDKEMKKSPRGCFVSKVEKNTNVICVRWSDKKVVTLISSYVGTEPVTKARRWSKAQKEHVEIDRPAIVEEYNKFMGGIDLLNMCSNMYKYHIKSRRWYMYLFFHTLTMALVNSWFLYRRHHQELGTNTKLVMSLRNFQAICAHALTRAGKGRKRSRGRPSLDGDRQPKQTKRRYFSVPREVQKDEINHLPQYDSSRQRCKLCPRAAAAFSYIKCVKCNAHLCLNKERNCFAEFHK